MGPAALQTRLAFSPALFPTLLPGKAQFLRPFAFTSSFPVGSNLLQV